MSDLWDYESRLQTTTRTDDGSYDQVIALSQGIINENFEKLYRLYPEMHRLYFMDASIGTIQGEVMAPRVLIPGADEPRENLKEVLFQIRFVSGYLRSQDGKTSIPDLSNWTLSVWVPIVPETLPDPETIEDPEVRKAVEEKIRRIKERFDYPGDYSVERLYIKLSSADWNHLDYERSVAGRDSNGNDIPYLHWKSLEANRTVARRLEFWMDVWSAELEENSMNSLGLSFKPPRQTRGMASFQPKELIHQVHHYKSKKNGAEKGQTGFGGAGDCNSLLYLEMVQGGGPTPREPRLLWSGNFATQAGGSDHPAIRATFLLNREIFFEKYLLTEFRGLNRASDVYHHVPWFDTSDENPTGFVNWNVGLDPSHPSDSDGIYNFKPVSDPNNVRKILSYRWTKKNKQGPVVVKQDVRDVWASASTESQMETNVTWIPGGSEIFLAYKSTTQEHMKWSTKADFSTKFGWFDDTYEMSWNMTLRIVPKEENNASYLFLEIVPRAGGVLYQSNVVYKPDRHGVEDSDHGPSLLRNMQSAMGRDLSRIISNIQKNLKTSGRFTYPGNGKLVFQNPGIGTYGDLNAQVQYVELSREDWVQIPTVEEQVPSRPPPFVQPEEGGGVPIISGHQLTWTMNALKALEPKQTLRVRGVNTTSKQVRFGGIMFGYRTGKRRGCLFSTDNFEYTPGSTDAETLEGEGEGEGDKGIVDVLGSTGQPPSSAVVNRLETVHGVTEWEVVVSTQSGQSLTVEPKAWIELVITADAGTAEMHKFGVDESIRDKDDNDIGHYDVDYDVRVS